MQGDPIEKVKANPVRVRIARGFKSRSFTHLFQYRLYLVVWKFIPFFSDRIMHIFFTSDTSKKKISRRKPPSESSRALHDTHYPSGQKTKTKKRHRVHACGIVYTGVVAIIVSVRSRRKIGRNDNHMSETAKTSLPRSPRLRQAQKRLIAASRTPDPKKHF